MDLPTLPPIVADVVVVTVESVAAAVGVVNAAFVNFVIVNLDQCRARLAAPFAVPGIAVVVALGRQLQLLDQLGGATIALNRLRVHPHFRRHPSRRRVVGRGPRGRAAVPIRYSLYTLVSIERAQQINQGQSPGSNWTFALYKAVRN